MEQTLIAPQTKGLGAPASQAPWRSRIVGHADVAPDDLVANPYNWRLHGKAQQAALEGALYDDVAPRALAHVVANAALIAGVEGTIEDSLARMPDQFSLARIRRERQQATRRLEADRDAAAWTATMERLDREEAQAQTVDGTRPTSHEIAESLADLQSLFLDAEPATQHRIVQALFEQVEVLGPSESGCIPASRRKPGAGRQL